MSESDCESRSGAPHQADDDGRNNSCSVPNVTLPNPAKRYRPLFSLESG